MFSFNAIIWSEITIDAWVVDGSLDHEIAQHGAVALDGDIFVFGGVKPGVHTDKAFFYHPANETSPSSNTTAPSMPGGRSSHGFVFHNGRVFALGGHQDGGECSRHSNVWSIDPLIDTTWDTTEVPLIDPLEDMGVVSLGDNIFSIGGHMQCPNTYLTRVDAINPDSTAPAWDTIANMSVGRRDPAVVEAYGKIYKLVEGF